MGATVKVVDRDRGWRALLKAVEALSGGSFVKVGVLADDAKGGMHEIGPDGKAADLTVAEIAAVLEFGTEDHHIPERSFVRSTFDEQRDELFKTAIKCCGGILDGKLSVGQSLNIMGAQLSTAIKNKITTGQGVPPPNAPSTAIAKAMKGKTARFFQPKKARHIGDSLADVGATQFVEGLGGHGRGGRKAVGAARSLGDAFAQIGAIASVRTLVDTGRLLGAVTWSVVMGSFSQGLGGNK